MGLTIAGGAVEIAHASRKNIRNKTHLIAITFAAFIFSLLSAGCMMFSLSASPEQLVFVYLIVAVLDAYSQVTCQLWGRHKLAPKISPNKTIEGAAGGTVAATLAAFVFHRLAGLTPTNGIVAGLLLSCAGVAGDLSASWFKRLNNVENFSAVLPGQGGILDRFNSLISAATVYMMLSSLLF
jgi:phosphatidate cytidylyltransferase